MQLSFFSNSDLENKSFYESEFIITKNKPLMSPQQVKDISKPDKERKVVTLST
jgi:hypothetical protein